MLKKERLLTIVEMVNKKETQFRIYKKQFAEI